MKNTTDKYFLCYSGVDLAGMGAEDMEPTIFYGTEEQAGIFAYEQALQMAEDEAEEDFEPEDMADYYAELLNSKALNSWSLWEELQAELNRNGHTFEEVYEEYSLEEED